MIGARYASAYFFSRSWPARLALCVTRESPRCPPWTNVNGDASYPPDEPENGIFARHYRRRSDPCGI